MEYFFYDTFKHDTFKHDICAEKHKRLILQKKCKNKDNDCSICLTSLFMRSVIYLPCKHVFHQRCLNQAVEAKLYTCPLCRYDLLDPLLKSGFTFPEVQTPLYRFDIENTSYILQAVLMGFHPVIAFLALDFRFSFEWVSLRH